MAAVEPVLLPQDLVPHHYDLSLVPDLETCTFTCDEQVHVTVKNETNSVTLHSREITVDTVVFIADGDSQSVAIEEIQYAVKAHTVKFIFEKTLPVGKGRLLISYRGILNGDMAGFYKSNYVDVNGVKKICASTQFEALDARRAFPCWDEPAMKATFSVTLTVPPQLTALSNMPEVSMVMVKDNKGGMLKKVTFDKSPLMSTYLLCWVVGEFDYIQAVTKGGVTLRVFSPPGRAEQGRFALDVGVRSLDFYDDFFKVPYPLPKLDMICITEFAMGAMENWGLVTYRETALMVDDATASVQTKQRVAIVVAHELAHQWFGNLVTMKWWDGLWLNEGFAAFMEHFCIDVICPEYDIWGQYVSDAYASAMRLDALRSSHPVIVPIKHAEEVEQVFDAISYCKGSVVVRMVYHLLGHQLFQEGLINYMRQYAYGNTNTPDLWGAWSAVSGKDVQGIMEVWTKQTGYPYLKVLKEVRNADGSLTVTLQQQRFLADGGSEGEQVWSIPLFFGTESGVSGEGSGAVLMTEQVQTFQLPASSWVKINAGSRALCRVVHSKDMLDRLRSGIERGEVQAVDRAALLLDAYALAKAGLAPLEDVVDILRSLKNEREHTVWSAIAGVLQGLHLLMEEKFSTPDSTAPTPFTKFLSFATSLVLPALKEVGWEGGAGEDFKAKILRSTVISLLDTFCVHEETIYNEAHKRFTQHFVDTHALPADYKGTVYRMVLQRGGADVYEKVLSVYRDTQDNQIRKYAMYTLGATRDVKLKLRTLDWAVKSGEVKLQDFFYPIGSVAGDKAGCQLAWNYYKDNFSTIKEMLKAAAPSLMDAVIVNSLGRFCTNAMADEVEAFFASHPLPQSSRRIAQVLENMRANAAMLEKLGSSKLGDVAFWGV